MEPNNISAGAPEMPNDNMGSGAPQPQPQPQSEAAMEMQAAIVADQIANPQPAPQPQENPMAVEPIVHKNGNKGMLIALVVFILIAVGGVGFGVWAMMDGNSQQETLNATISSLKKQNNDLQDQVAELNEKIEKLEKEAANNANSNGNANNNTNENGTNEAINVTAEVLNGVFYIKDESGIVVARDDARTVTEILSCGNSATSSSMVCEVVTSEGNGTYTYDILNKTLNFTAAPKEEEKPQE